MTSEEYRKKEWEKMLKRLGIFEKALLDVLVLLAHSDISETPRGRNLKLRIDSMIHEALQNHEP
jgi:hypothetical protein